ncbi:MAG: ABC transporter substrate-binding protein, partial [Actinomycetota bacterium]
LAVRAVDCALESARAVRRLGLRIRAGVHMGECVVTQEKVRGVTVHIGARVGAKARGDEVLVSSTVRDILADARLKFADRGEQTLKGVDGKWRLYAVEPRVRDNESDLPPLLETEIAGPPKPTWQKPRALAAIATALAVLIGAITFVTLRGGGLSVVPADSVAMIDAGSGDVISSMPVQRRPVGIVAAPDGIWVTNSIDRSVTHIATNGRSKDTIPVGNGPIAVAAGGGNIWVANADGRSVSRVDPKTGKEVGERIEAGNGLSSIAYGSGALWLSNAVDGTVWRVDPATAKRTEIPVVSGLRGIVATDDVVWVTSETTGTATRLDPKQGVIVRVVKVGNGPGAVALGGGSVWVANAYDGTVSRVDPESGRVATTIRVGRGPRAIATTRDRVFVANEESGTVSMIDMGSGRVIRTIRTANAPMGLAAASSGDRVWVTVRGGIARYKGGTLRVGTRDVALTFDPSVGPSDLVSFFIVPNIYDGLTAYKRVGGPEGSQLVPNLVEEIRPPTDEGLTYSFTLRAGLKYSDGSPVRASDVRATFERILRHEGWYGGAFLRALKGSDACDEQRCDLSAGVVVDDASRTVVFHLRRSYPEFPYTLALPKMVILPASAPPDDAGTQPIPGTGPYRITSGALIRGRGGDITGGSMVLERNPHFRSRGLSQPDAYPDRIEVTLGGERTDHIDAVKAGKEDYTPDVPFSGISIAELAAGYPSQIRAVEHPTTSFALLNLNVAPFNDVRARRALNYALDRRAVARDLGAPLNAAITCQLLPENMIGYAPHCPYTLNPNPSGVWTAPDIAIGARLVERSGTKGQRVIVWIEEAGTTGAIRRRRVAPHVVTALKAIGYRAEIREVPGGNEGYFSHFADPENTLQVMLTGWQSEYPGPANFFLPLTTCDETIDLFGSGPAIATHYCSPDVDKLLLQAFDLQERDPAASAKVWAQLDRVITDAAPFVNIANIRNVLFTSPRVGNVQGHTTYGVLLSQMWVVEERTPSPS